MTTKQALTYILVALFAALTITAVAWFVYDGITRSDRLNAEIKQTCIVEGGTYVVTPGGGMCIGGASRE